MAILDGTKKPATTSYISSDNSSTTLLTNGTSFTGTWEDVGQYDSVVVAVKTDQNGYFSVQFSPDGTNTDSTLTRYYRTSVIEPPHRFTITRRYMRVVFTNDSGSDQTYLRLQTTVGTKGDLNAPIDSTLAPDFDAIVVRPTSINDEIALGRRQGVTLWQKFGYNADIDTGTEDLWAPGGSFTRLPSAQTLDIVSSSANDTNGGTGANTILLYGIDANWDIQNVTETMNGTTTVTTDETYLGVNRVAITSSGSGEKNAGNITITGNTSSTTQAYLPAGESVTQQLIFFVPRDHQALIRGVYLNAIKTSGGTKPELTIKLWVYSAVTTTEYEIYRKQIDLAVDNEMSVVFDSPLQVGEKSVVRMAVTTDIDNASVNGRIVYHLYKDVDSVA